MKHSQKGFTYPVTLSILLSMCLFLTVTSEMLLIDRKMAVELETIQHQDYYFLIAVNRTEREFQANGIKASGSYSLQDGRISYSTTFSSNGQYTVLFTVFLTEAEGIEAKGYSIYDNNLKKMVKWVKKN